jgi:hypothetical protein
MFVKSVSIACLMVAIASCAFTRSLEPFPADFWYEVDTTHKICGKWRIVNKEHMLVMHQRDMPLEECNAVIGYDAEDAAKVRRWVQEAQK